MHRKEFLSMIGAGAAAVACLSCLDGCKADPGVTAPPPANVDFTLDLNDPANNALKTIGGYLYKDSLIVARLSSQVYAALSMICTHAGGTVFYDPQNNRFHCPNHGSNFGTDGTVLNGPAGSPLARYNTTLNGTSLRVYS